MVIGDALKWTIDPLLPIGGFSKVMLTINGEEYVDGDGLTELKCTILTLFFLTVAFQMPPQVPQPLTNFIIRITLTLVVMVS